MSEPAVASGATRTIYDVRGMDCAECARSVATAVERLPGVSTAVVNFGAGTLIVESEPDSRIDLAPKVLNAVEMAGYRALSRDGARSRKDPSPLAERRAQLAIVSVALWVLGAFLSVGANASTAASVAYGCAVIAGAWTFGRAALQAIGGRRIDMNVLMTLAIGGALLLGDWAEAAAAAALFALGNLAQSLTFDRTRSALSSLSTLAPSEAVRVSDGRDELVPVDLLAIGDVIRVRPGERFPLDGTILEGATTVDESLVTGESRSAEKRAGAQIYAGSLNESGSVLMRATHIASQSTLANIVELVEQARGGRGHAQQTIDRFAAIYTPIVVASAIVVALVGGALTSDWTEWATRGLVLLVIACPCALVISTPVAIVSAVGIAAKRGFLVKGGAALESIASVRAVVFDKTGTLTRGRPSVAAIVPVDADEDSLLRLAAAVEMLSEHPLGFAIVDRAVRGNISIPAASEFASIPGRGAQARVDGRLIQVGSPAWFDELAFEYPRSVVGRAAQGRTVLLMADDSRFMGHIALIDQLRPESATVVERLRRMRLSPVAMMTGDNRSTAETIAGQCGIDRVYAELLPAEKSARIAELRQVTGPVAMVGDGVNDGPALGSATVGFAMGLTGSDLAIETADVAILRNDLFAVPGAIDLARRTVAIIRQNIAVSLVVKAAALVLTLLGVTTLWMAVAVDVGTSLLVTANALRLTRWQLPGSGHRQGSHNQSEVGLAIGEATGDA